MLLKELLIENYGVYGGMNSFDLATTLDKPVILIGGFNGAGKTTILESMMMVLYGHIYLGKKKSKKEYEEFILNHIHRNADGKRSSSASVSLSFLFHHDGVEDSYSVKRSWIVSGASVSELFLVERNGHPMNDIDESQWQSFIDGMLPLEIAKLFFLDGEKIVQVTKKNGQYNDQIKTSLEMLLGAEIIKRLRADLNLFMLRHSAKQGDVFNNEYKHINAEKEQVVSDIELLVDELERKNRLMDEVNNIITKKESVVSGIGGGYADLRGNLLVKKAILSEKMTHMSRTIQDSFAEDAPFHLIPILLGQLVEQIKSDTTLIQNQFIHDVERRVEDKLRHKMSEPDFWPDGIDVTMMSTKILNALSTGYSKNTVSGIGDDNVGSSTCDTTTPVFGLSQDDSVKVLQGIEMVPENSMSLLDILSQYASIAGQIENVDAELAKIPSDDELGPKISEINSLHQELGILKAEIDHIEQQISSKRSYKNILRSRLKKVIESIHKNENTSTGVMLASKMQSVLDTYYSNLKKRKIAVLESNLLDTIRVLLHKDFISRIEIDADSFEIRAYSGSDKPVHIDTLSMGEKQIIGTALLWAIARTSGRALPFVIDTPLGRLDGMHRDNLTERFYPSASHQTILLSTDKEIGRVEYEEMKDLVSKSYCIIYDKKHSNTNVTQGYFTK